MQSGPPTRDHMQDFDYVRATTAQPHIISPSVAVVRSNTRATAFLAAAARVRIRLFSSAYWSSLVLPPNRLPKLGITAAGPAGGGTSGAGAGCGADCGAVRFFAAFFFLVFLAALRAAFFIPFFFFFLRAKTARFAFDFLTFDFFFFRFFDFAMIILPIGSIKTRQRIR
jgi:hypothetical protein